MKNDKKYNKRILKIAAVMLTLCLIAGMALSVSAAKNYTYTVTVEGGNCGVVNGPTVVEIGYNEIWNPNNYSVTVTDDRYYFKGFHISGQEEIVGAVPITQDTVFIASYGMKGDMVAYTVNYQTADGTTLLPSQTFYGNVGENAVIAYTYIEGYLPQEYNLSRVLSANEADNIFTFIYNAIEVPTEPETTTAAPANTPATPAGGGGAAPAEGGAAAPAEGGAAAPAEGGEAAPAEGGTEGGQEGEGTEGLVDVTENATPTTATPDEERTYDGFKVTTDTGLGDGGEPDAEGLYTLDDAEVAMSAGPGTTKDRGQKLRNAVYDADGNIIHTYNYAPAQKYEGITAFPGALAKLINK